MELHPKGNIAGRSVTGAAWPRPRRLGGVGAIRCQQGVPFLPSLSKGQTAWDNCGVCVCREEGVCLMGRKLKEQWKRTREVMNHLPFASVSTEAKVEGQDSYPPSLRRPLG